MVGNRESMPRSIAGRVLTRMLVAVSLLVIASPAPARSQQFERYFAANDVSKGGSFYLQSKIYRARELLTEFQEEKRREESEDAK